MRVLGLTDERAGITLRERYVDPGCASRGQERKGYQREYNKLFHG